MASIKESVIDARKCENLNDPIDNYVLDYVAMFSLVSLSSSASSPTSSPFSRVSSGLREASS
ncbi:MAG: hypothetical protein J6U39_05245 [Clostridia bacterium]|nr:hypothetical protein [Clostridia bacterium]